eukprot:1196103-Prorocentrum_minimum.AAC.2
MARYDMQKAATFHTELRQAKLFASIAPFVPSLPADPTNSFYLPGNPKMTTKRRRELLETFAAAEGPALLCSARALQMNTPSMGVNPPTMGVNPPLMGANPTSIDMNTPSTKKETSRPHT